MQPVFLQSALAVRTCNIKGILDEPQTYTPAPLPFIARLRIVRRQTTRLGILVVITVAAFGLTRWMAGTARAMHRDDAARWHALGQERLAVGDTAGAITALRNAAMMNPEARAVQLELAAAYRAAGAAADARSVLLRMREQFPEDPEVNLRLATLEAENGRTEEAIRHYQATLLALWGPQQLDRRRSLRIRYIEFLLAHELGPRALSETLLLAGEIPDDAASHLTVGDLLLRSGDPRRGLIQFEAALELEPRNLDALARAGEAAFETGSFRLAHRYLTRAAGEPRSAALLVLVDTIISLDPLLPGLTTGERHRRVLSASARLAAELASCRSRLCETPGARCDQAAGIVKELETASASLRRRRASDEAVDAGLSTVTGISERVTAVCRTAGTTGRALALIAKHHGVDQ